MIRKTAAALIAAVALVVAPLTASNAASATEAATRIMLVGDSITQGQSGFYTWRYDLWRSLDAAGDYNLVGPRSDQFESDNGIDNEYTTSGYPDPNFDRNHAARWGMALGLRDWNLNHLTAQYKPDAVVLALGTNDVLWFPGTQQDYAPHIAAAVQEIRDAAFWMEGRKPAVVLTQVYRENDQHPDARENWNAAAAQVAAEMSEPTSPVTVADYSAVNPATDTYDTVHPNRFGEIKIAEAVRSGLAAVGVATNSAYISAPAAARASDVAAKPVKGGVRVSWKRPSASADADLWKRSKVKVKGKWRAWGPWKRVTAALPIAQADDLLAPASRPTRHQYRVRAYDGGMASGWTTSNVVLRRP